MEINHGYTKTISNYITKDTRNAFRIKKSSSASTLMTVATQKKYESRLNYPSNISIITPIKNIQTPRNMKLKFNEPIIIQKVSRTRNALHITNKPKSPFVIKSFDSLNLYYEQSKPLINPTDSKGVNIFNYSPIKSKAHLKPFDEKYLCSLDKRYHGLKQQLSENCLFVQHQSLNNNNSTKNIKLSKKQVYNSVTDRESSNQGDNNIIGNDDNFFSRNKVKVLQRKSESKPKFAYKTIKKDKENDNGNSNDNDIDNDSEKDKDKAKDSKHSELKTDTDSKERNGNNQNISEVSRMTNNTMINIQITNPYELQSKRGNSTKNVQFNLKTNENQSKSSSNLNLITSQIGFLKPKKNTSLLTPPVLKTNIKLIDDLTSTISQSLLKINRVSCKTKQAFLLTQMHKLNQKEKDICNQIPIKTSHRYSYSDGLNNNGSTWEIDSSFLIFHHQFILPLSIINYLTTTYITIDSSGVSDYLFGIKSNLFLTNQIRTTARVIKTQKTNVFKNLTITKGQEYTKTSLLHLQRFIQNDCNISQNKQLDRDWIQNRKNTKHNSTKIPKKKGTSFILLPKKNEMINLSILKKRRFFLLESTTSHNSINKAFESRKSIKDISLSSMLPEIKKLILELNDCLVINSNNIGQDFTPDIINAFLYPGALFDLLIKLIQSNACGLIDRCLRYKIDYNIDMQNDKGNTLLIIATKLNSLTIAQYLLQKGANANMQNNYGNTAMHYAVAHKTFDVVDLLTRHGGREDILNNDKMTPWECGNKNLEENE